MCRRTRLLKGMIAALILVLCGGVFPGTVRTPLAPAVVRAAEQRTTTTALNMRASAGVKGKQILVIPKGKTVDVLEKAQGNWLKVKYGKKTGFVNGKYLSKTALKAKPAKKQTKVMAENLNMRSSMSKANDKNIVTVIPKGATVTILSKEKDQWFRVSYKKYTGYIKGGHFTDDTSRMGIGSVNPEKKKTTTSLNMRSSASSASKKNILLVIPKGATVTVIGKEADNWWKVTYKKQTGYVKGTYLK